MRTASDVQILDDDGNPIDILQKASSGTSTSVTVGSTSTTVLASNASRILAILVNDSNEDIYLFYGTPAVMNQGILLKASGGSIVEDHYTGQITAICSSGSKNLTVTTL